MENRLYNLNFINERTGSFIEPKSQSKDKIVIKSALVRNNRMKQIKDNVDTSHRLYTFKDKLHCCFCGGKSCKHENYLNNHKSYLTGLHSDLISSELIASQRPSTILLSKFDIIQQMKDKNIGMIVNLQREGEHPYCGPNMKLEDSGFSYNPHDFISEGISVILAGWKDMSVPDSMLYILTIVKQMYEFIITRKKKVLIHCHAGYGRTGILLACYILFTTKKSVKQVVQEIRNIRKGCIQSKSQFSYCETFYRYITLGRSVFTLGKKSLESHLFNQNNFLIPHSIDFRKEEEYKYIPRIVVDVLDKIILLLSKGNKLMSNIITKKKSNSPYKQIKLRDNFNVLNINYSNSMNIASNIQIIEELPKELSSEKQENKYTLFDALLGLTYWNKDNDSLLEYFKQSINLGNWYVIKNFSNLDILIELMWDWMDESVNFLISPEKVSLLFSIKDIDSLENLDKEGAEAIQDFITLLKSKINYNEYSILCFISYFIHFIETSFGTESTISERILYKFAVLLLGYGLHYYHEFYHEKDFKLTEHSMHIQSYSVNNAHDNIILNSQSGNSIGLLHKKGTKHLYSKVFNTFLLVKLLKALVALIRKDFNLQFEFNFIR